MFLLVRNVLPDNKPGSGKPVELVRKAIDQGKELFEIAVDVMVGGRSQDLSTGFCRYQLCRHHTRFKLLPCPLTVQRSHARVPTQIHHPFELFAFVDSMNMNDCITSLRNDCIVNTPTTRISLDSDYHFHYGLFGIYHPCSKRCG